MPASGKQAIGGLTARPFKGTFLHFMHTWHVRITQVGNLWASQVKIWSLNSAQRTETAMSAGNALSEHAGKPSVYERQCPLQHIQSAVHPHCLYVRRNITAIVARQ